MRVSGFDHWFTFCDAVGVDFLEEYPKFLNQLINELKIWSNKSLETIPQFIRLLIQFPLLKRDELILTLLTQNEGLLFNENQNKENDDQDNENDNKNENDRHDDDTEWKSSIDIVLYYCWAFKEPIEMLDEYFEKTIDMLVKLLKSDKKRRNHVFELALCSKKEEIVSKLQESLDRKTVNLIRSIYVPKIDCFTFLVRACYKAVEKVILDDNLIHIVFEWANDVEPQAVPKDDTDLLKLDDS